MIEPIFEADFQDSSYGFRPKRSAHHAVQDVTEHLWQGKTDVIDADISKYFDTIPHDKLMLRHVNLRMLMEEDNWKAVYGKTARTV